VDEFGWRYAAKRWEVETGRTVSKEIVHLRGGKAKPVEGIYELQDFSSP
jgi:hypothetical protein